MTDSPKHDFRTTELDPDLLSTPYKIQTNWHVISGAPSCGKSTLINLLADEGFHTVPESARKYMEREVASGRPIEEVHQNGATLQHGIKATQMVVEAELGVDEVIFLDGSVSGSLSWYRIFGLDPNDVLPDCFHHRYASVFVLDRLSLQLNGFRFEDDAIPGFLDEWIERDHRALGYDVVRVPVLAPKERFAFVLKKLSEQGLI